MIIAVLTLGLAAISQGIGQFHAYRIVSGSMAPSLPVGSLTIVRSLPAQSYKVGDIVTFTAPTHPVAIVTHRVTRMYRTFQDVLVAETKGDANTNGDPWVISVGTIKGRVVLAIPWMGWVLGLAKTTFGFLVFACLLFLGIVWGELVIIWRYLSAGVSD